jgi:hypothetical protein
VLADATNLGLTRMARSWGQRTICSKSYAKRDQWAALLARRLV